MEGTSSSSSAGGFTPVVQTCNTDLHQAVKRAYISSMETEKFIDRIVGGALGVFRRLGRAFSQSSPSQPDSETFLAASVSNDSHNEKGLKKHLKDNNITWAPRNPPGRWGIPCSPGSINAITPPPRGLNVVEHTPTQDPNELSSRLIDSAVAAVMDYN